MDCIFCKIINGEIPSDIVYEDDDMVIINDISPQADKHYLLIPKEHYANLSELNASRAAILSRCLLQVKELSESLGLGDGYRLVSNCGELAGQTVFHLHIHLLGGQKLSERMV